jgi:hypothetical protein
MRTNLVKRSKPLSSASGLRFDNIQIPRTIRALGSYAMRPGCKRPPRESSLAEGSPR